MTKLGHRPRLNLPDPFPGEIKVLANFFKSSRFTSVKSEPELKNFSFSFIERAEKFGDFIGEPSNRSSFLGIFSVSIFDDIA